MTDALERLIEAVRIDSVNWYGWAERTEALPANLWEVAREADVKGSLDAALTLLAALLPDHDWGRAPSGQMWVQRPPAAPVWSGDGYPPARGLLLAILRAKLAEAQQETSD